jgi:hypothetical protein
LNIPDEYSERKEKKVNTRGEGVRKGKRVRKPTWTQ